MFDEPEERIFPFGLSLLVGPLTRILLGRGELEAARAVLSQAHPSDTSDRQSQAVYRLVEASLFAAQGRPKEALATAEESLEQWQALHQFQNVTEALVEAADSAFELDDLERVEALLVMAEGFPLVQRRPFLDAQTARLGAKLAARRGEPADEGFDAAARILRDLEMPFWLGVTLVEHAEYRLREERGDEAEPLLAEADTIFARLRAEPWSTRVQSARGLVTSSAAS